MKHRITITTKPGIAAVGSTVTLQKDKRNEFDSEAIAVIVNGTPDGFVSAFYKTRKAGTISGGRLYEKMQGDTLTGTVVAEQIVEVETER